jgi:hypothetical protein
MVAPLIGVLSDLSCSFPLIENVCALLAYENAKRNSTMNQDLMQEVMLFGRQRALKPSERFSTLSLQAFISETYLSAVGVTT